MKSIDGQVSAVEAAKNGNFTAASSSIAKTFFFAPRLCSGSDPGKKVGRHFNALPARNLFPVLLWLTFSHSAGAHSIVVDGASGDWWGTLPASANIGRIVRNAAGQGEYVWHDAAGDERTDLASPDSQADITQVRVTGDTNGLGIFIGTTAAPSTNIQVQIAIDTDRVAESGQQFLAGVADTRVSSAAGWERLIFTRFASGGTAAVLDTNLTIVASTPGSARHEWH